MQFTHLAMALFAAVALGAPAAAPSDIFESSAPKSDAELFTTGGRFHKEYHAAGSKRRAKMAGLTSVVARPATTLRPIGNVVSHLSKCNTLNVEVWS